jgi:hypothetical protein
MTHKKCRRAGFSGDDTAVFTSVPLSATPSAVMDWRTSAVLAQASPGATLVATQPGGRQFMFRRSAILNGLRVSQLWTIGADGQSFKVAD